MFLDEKKIDKNDFEKSLHFEGGGQDQFGKSLHFKFFFMTASLSKRFAERMQIDK